eukprot:14626-Heterococcus_DN1.PRE.3
MINCTSAVQSAYELFKDYAHRFIKCESTGSHLMLLSFASAMLKSSDLRLAITALTLSFIESPATATRGLIAMQASFSKRAVRWDAKAHLSAECKGCTIEC